MAQVRARRQGLDAAHGVLIILAAEPPDKLARVAQRLEWTDPVLADPERRVYHMYGLHRLPWHRIVTLRGAGKYLGFLFRGIFPGAPGQDVRQQGGDFLVDAAGAVRYARVGQYADDRPPVDELLEHLRRLGPGPG